MKKQRKKGFMLLFSIVFAGMLLSAKAENIAAAPDVNVKEDGSYSVTFTYKNDKAQNVYVGGDFNAYAVNDPTWKMEKNESGEWELTVDLAEGVWQYWFLADGIWVNDPENMTYYPDSQGNKLVVSSVTKSPVVDGNTVTFQYPVSMVPADATRVTVTGAFNNWAEQEMCLSADGTHYTCSFNGLPANTYEYGFHVYTPATAANAYQTCREYCGDYYNMHASCLGGNSVFTIQQPQQQVNPAPVYTYTPSYGCHGHGSYYNYNSNGGYGHRGHCH